MVVEAEDLRLIQAKPRPWRRNPKPRRSTIVDLESRTSRTSSRRSACVQRYALDILSSGGLHTSLVHLGQLLSHPPEPTPQVPNIGGRKTMFVSSIDTWASMFGRCFTRPPPLGQPRANPRHRPRAENRQILLASQTWIEQPSLAHPTLTSGWTLRRRSVPFDTTPRKAATTHGMRRLLLPSVALCRTRRTGESMKAAGARIWGGCATAREDTRLKLDL